MAKQDGVSHKLSMLSRAANFEHVLPPPSCCNRTSRHRSWDKDGHRREQKEPLKHYRQMLKVLGLAEVCFPNQEPVSSRERAKGRG